MKSATAIASRRVPDPSMSDAEYAYQRRCRPNNPHVGTVVVTENAATRIGGLCYIRRREPHHERAAELFRARYEAAYGSGTPAADMSREPVDTSIIASDAGMAGRVDNARIVRAAISELGRERADRIIACVVLGARVDADVLPSGKPNWRQQRQGVDALLDALDALAEMWHLKTRA